MTCKVSLGAEPPWNEGTATSEQRQEREKVSDTTRQGKQGKGAEKEDKGNVASCRQRPFSAQQRSYRTSLELLGGTQKRKAHTSAGDKLLLGCFVLGTRAQL